MSTSLEDIGVPLASWDSPFAVIVPELLTWERVELSLPSPMLTDPKLYAMLVTLLEDDGEKLILKE